jgi:hypothetical protein
MRKKASIVKLVLFIMTLSICLTACSVPDKSSDDLNHSSSTSQIKGTGIENPTISPNQSAPQENTKTAKPSSSPSDGNGLDYSQYIHKIWIVKSLLKSKDSKISFFISNIENGNLEGRCTLNGLRSYCKPSIGQKDYAYLTGTIKNGIANCEAGDPISKGGASFQLKFKTDDEIELIYPDFNESYIYSPYTINDLMELQGFTLNKSQSITANLNSWGTVNFVTCERSDSPVPYFYLTDKDGDVLYDLTLVLMPDSEIRAVSFHDVNKDGLKDIIIIVANKNDSSNITAKVIMQQADGSFDVDGELNKEINDSGNNKDIKSVTDYLSKKF